MTRLECLHALYQALDEAHRRHGGFASFATVKRADVPHYGVYFFFEAGEQRSGSGVGPRVVRVGTHAISSTSTATLWQRLAAHRGTVKSGSGNHRGSIFRLLIGDALCRRDNALLMTWGKGSKAPHHVRESERSLERMVSHYIRLMPFIWLEADSREERARLERASIAALSNYDRVPIDPPSSMWLGLYSSRDKIRRSGLWNSEYVDVLPTEETLTVLSRI